MAKGSAKNKYHSGGLSPNRRKVIPSKLNVSGLGAVSGKPSKRNYGSGGKGIAKTKFSK